MSKVSFGRRSKHLVSSAYNATRNRRVAEERQRICRRQMELAMIIVERRGDYDRRAGEHRDKSLKLNTICLLLLLLAGCTSLPECPPGDDVCERLNTRLKYQRETAIISAGLSGALIAVGFIASAAIVAPAIDGVASGITVNMGP